MKVALFSFAIAATLGAVESLLTKKDFDDYGEILGACQGLPCESDDELTCYCEASIFETCAPQGGCAPNKSDLSGCYCRESSIEGLLGVDVGADTYAFTVSLSNDNISYINARGNICLMKAAVEEPKWTPVWVTSAPFEDMTFMWEKNYKAFYSNSFYNGGVAIKVGGDEPTKLGKCTTLTTDDILVPCQEDPGPKAIALRNDRVTGDWTMGLEQTLAIGNGEKALLLGDNPFYSTIMGNEGGLVFVEPVEQVTIGICDMGEGELTKFTSLSGATTFTVSPTSRVAVTFNGANFVASQAGGEAVDVMLRGAEAA